MASQADWLFGNPLNPDEEQGAAQSPFLTPSGVGPGNVGPSALGPSPIGAPVTPAPQQQEVTPMLQQAKPQAVQPAETVQDVVQQKNTSASQSFSEWLELNKTKSETEWWKSKWKNSGKLGKLAMLLDAAASGVSGFNQAYLPSQGTSPGKPYESFLQRQHAQYAQLNEKEIATRASMVRQQNQELETMRKAAKDVGQLQQGNVRNTLQYYKMVSSGMLADNESRMDAAKFAAAQQDAQVKISQYNETERRRWAEYYGGLTPNNLQEALAQALFRQYGNDPAELAAQVSAHMMMIEQQKARSRAIGRGTGAGSYSTGALNEWAITEDGELKNIKGKAFYGKPGTQTEGKFAGMTSTGKRFSPADYRKFMSADTAKKLGHFVETTRQADIALKAAAQAARNNEPMFGIKGSEWITKVRRMADEYGLEKVLGDTPTEEPLILIALKNAAMMHGRGQIGYRPAMELVESLEKEIGGGALASRRTKLKAIAMFKFLTEYSGAQLVDEFEMSPEDFASIEQKMDMWVDSVILGKGPIKDLGTLEELWGSDYTSGINWGSGTYDPDRINTQPVIGAY